MLVAPPSPSRKQEVAGTTEEGYYYEYARVALGAVFVIGKGLKAEFQVDSRIGQVQSRHLDEVVG